VLQVETHHHFAQSSHQVPNPSKLLISQSDLLKSSTVPRNVLDVVEPRATVPYVIRTEKKPQSVNVLTNSTKVPPKSVLLVKDNVSLVSLPRNVKNVLLTEMLLLYQIVPVIKDSMMTERTPNVKNVTTNVSLVKTPTLAPNVK
jgi:hypothetical protein